MQQKFKFTFFLLLMAVSSRAQDDSLKSILGKFNEYNNQSFQEKIYLHTDRTFYLTGDFLWFKIYVVDAREHRPVDLSKIAYIEILDLQNNPIVQAKVALKNGKGSSSIFLPASLNSGNFRLRAYTKWMQNFPPDFYFHKQITIVNPFKPLQQQEIGTTGNLDIQFFPEGGELIAGIETKIAYRVADHTGKGVSFKGWIIDENYDTLATFSPLKYGLGNFALTPEPGIRYRIVLQDLSGKIIGMKELPAAKYEGYSLRVNEQNDKLRVTVTCRFDENKLRVVHFVAHARGKLIAADTRGLHQNSATFTIDKKSLPGGISHFTVFDQNARPQCERLYFTRPTEVLDVSGATERNQYASREKVNLKITTRSTKPYAGHADLSVSVFRLDSLQLEDPVSIENYLLLFSDLKGTIEAPSYYFSDDENVREAVDNLMLTHGWRRFQWNNVLADKRDKLAFIPEYRGHLITGSISNETTGEPAINVPAYLSIPGRHFQLRGTKSNRAGEIKFELKDFYGPNKVIVQTNSQVDSVYRIKITNPFSDQFAEALPAPLNLQEKFAEQLVTRSVGMQLENAYFEKHRGRIRSIARDTIPFYDRPDEHYDLDDYTRFPVMEDVMREYVPGILVRKRKKDFYFLTVNDINNTVFRDNPLVLLDGIPVFRINAIMEYDPLKVKSLDVITRKYFYGPLSFSGLASYRTYDGDYPDFPIDPRALVLDYEGVLWDREFFSPIYETKDQQLSRIPDSRQLLFWSPNIHTSKEGGANVVFYTSDQPGTYLVNIQGLSGEGLSGSASFKLKVTTPPNN